MHVALSIQNRPLTEGELNERHVPSACRKNQLDKAVASKVVAFGVFATEFGFKLVETVNERLLLEKLWGYVAACLDTRTVVVGAELHQFDLPLAVQRSWAVDVKVPREVFTYEGNIARWNPLLVDIQLAFTLQTFKPCSFDSMARLLGTGGRYRGHQRGAFATLWKKNSEEAAKFLATEVRQPYEWARRMGIGT